MYMVGSLSTALGRRSRRENKCIGGGRGKYRVERAIRHGYRSVPDGREGTKNENRYSFDCSVELQHECVEKRLRKKG